MEAVGDSALTSALHRYGLCEDSGAKEHPGAQEARAREAAGAARLAAYVTHERAVAVVSSSAYMAAPMNNPHAKMR